MYKMGIKSIKESITKALSRLERGAMAEALEAAKASLRPLFLAFLQRMGD